MGYWWPGTCLAFSKKDRKHCLHWNTQKVSFRPLQNPERVMFFLLEQLFLSIFIIFNWNLFTMKCYDFMFRYVVLMLLMSNFRHWICVQFFKLFSPLIRLIWLGVILMIPLVTYTRNKSIKMSLSCCFFFLVCGTDIPTKQIVS
jgi:hypothetical protein